MLSGLLDLAGLACLVEAAYLLGGRPAAFIASGLSLILLSQAVSQKADQTAARTLLGALRGAVRPLVALARRFPHPRRRAAERPASVSPASQPISSLGR